MSPVDVSTDYSHGVRRGPIRATVTLAATELKLLVREPGVAVSLIAFPLVTVLVLAGVFGQGPDPDFAGVAPSDHYITGYLGVVLASMGLITIPAHIATQRELGILRRYRAAGIDAPTIVFRDVLLGVVLGVVSGAVVLAAGSAVYGLQAPQHPWSVAGWFVIGLLCFMRSASRSARCCRRVGRHRPSATSCSCRCSCSAAGAHRAP